MSEPARAAVEQDPLEREASLAAAQASPLAAARVSPLADARVSLADTQASPLAAAQVSPLAAARVSPLAAAQASPLASLARTAPGPSRATVELDGDAAGAAGHLVARSHPAGAVGDTEAANRACQRALIDGRAAREALERYRAAVDALDVAGVQRAGHGAIQRWERGHRLLDQVADYLASSPPIAGQPAAVLAARAGLAAARTAPTFEVALVADRLVAALSPRSFRGTPVAGAAAPVDRDQLGAAARRELESTVGVVGLVAGLRATLHRAPGQLGDAIAQLELTRSRPLHYHFARAALTAEGLGALFDSERLGSLDRRVKAQEEVTGVDADVGEWDAAAAREQLALRGVVLASGETAFGHDHVPATLARQLLSAEPAARDGIAGQLDRLGALDDVLAALPLAALQSLARQIRSAKPRDKVLDAIGVLQGSKSLSRSMEETACELGREDRPIAAGVVAAGELAYHVVTLGFAARHDAALDALADGDLSEAGYHSITARELLRVGVQAGLTAIAGPVVGGAMRGAAQGVIASRTIASGVGVATAEATLGVAGRAIDDGFDLAIYGERQNQNSYLEDALVPGALGGLTAYRSSLRYRTGRALRSAPLDDGRRTLGAPHAAELRAYGNALSPDQQAAAIAHAVEVDELTARARASGVTDEDTALRAEGVGVRTTHRLLVTEQVLAEALAARTWTPELEQRMRDVYAAAPLDPRGRQMAKVVPAREVDRYATMVDGRPVPLDQPIQAGGFVTERAALDGVMAVEASQRRAAVLEHLGMNASGATQLATLKASRVFDAEIAALEAELGTTDPDRVGRELVVRVHEQHLRRPGAGGPPRAIRDALARTPYVAQTIETLFLVTFETEVPTQVPDVHPRGDARGARLGTTEPVFGHRAGVGKTRGGAPEGKLVPGSPITVVAIEEVASGVMPAGVDGFRGAFGDGRPSGRPELDASAAAELARHAVRADRDDR